jgi:hypothetical protein
MGGGNHRGRSAWQRLALLVGTGLAVLGLASVPMVQAHGKGSESHLAGDGGRRSRESAVPPSPGRIARFYLPGANGYRVQVVAAVEGPGSPVRIVVENHRGNAEYQVPGNVTSTKIQASFGELGHVSLRFLPSGRVLHSLSEGGGCSLHAKARLGVFVGSFRFHGEGGYTTVNAHRIRGGVGSPTAPINSREQGKLGCQNAAETHIVPLDQIQQRISGGRPLSEASPKGPGETPWSGVVSAAVAQDEATLFLAASFSVRHPEEEGAKPEVCIFAATNEETRGDIAIARSVFQGGPVAQCAFAESGATFNVSPEPPFSGTASYHRSADGSATWLGSLSVPMPGCGPVALAGPTFATELVQR